MSVLEFLRFSSFFLLWSIRTVFRSSNKLFTRKPCLDFNLVRLLSWLIKGGHVQSGGSLTSHCGQKVFFSPLIYMSSNYLFGVLRYYGWNWKVQFDSKQRAVDHAKKIILPRYFCHKKRQKTMTQTVVSQMVHGWTGNRRLKTDRAFCSS